jgi:hypothetical protein
LTATPQPTPAICVGISGDSVQIASLRVGPSNTSNTSSVLGGGRRIDRYVANLNIEMTINNVSGRDLISVAWGITSDDGQANTASVNIPRCSSVKVSLSWPRQSGSHTFTGDVDPLNTLGETESGFSNNHQTFVYVPTPTLTVVLTTQELDYEKAQAAGARFLDNRKTPIGTCTRIGQENAQNSRDYGTGQPGVVFVADSPYIGTFATVQLGTGCTANPEAFKDFHLKNGWRVKSVSMKFTINKENQADIHDSFEETQSPGERHLEGFSTMTTPTIGSDDPHIQVHISVEAAAFLKVYAKITILGPPGTDPYGATCAAGFAPVTTASGPGCARADWAHCNARTLLQQACVDNGDCASGYICATNLCAVGKCVRGHAP